MSEAHIENNKSKLLVEAIANGTVIDHIAPGQAINIIRIILSIHQFHPYFPRSSFQSQNRRVLLQTRPS